MKPPEYSATASVRLSSEAPSAASSRKRSTSSSRPGSPLQGDAVAGGVDPFLADCRAQGRERAAQRTASVIRVVGRPQQAAERIARAGAVGERQVSQQRHRLAGVEGHPLAVPFDPRGAEQLDLERHSATIVAAVTGFVTHPGRSRGRVSGENDGGAE